MSVLGLAWRGLRSRKLSSVLTIISVALGVALIVAILSVRSSTKRSFLTAARGYDLILGPTTGSPLGTVLNTLFHVGESGGNIPYEVFTKVERDPRVKFAVPYAVGDSYRGHHVVGTTLDHFEVLTDAKKTALGADVVGSLFTPGRFDAVVGSVAAANTGLRLGSTFRVMHGVETPTHEHEEDWVVTGILRPTGTPSDRAIFIPLATFYAIGGHAEGAESVRKRREEKGRALSGGADDQGQDSDEDPQEDEHDGDGAAPSDDMATLGLSAIGVRLVSPYLRIGYKAELQQDQAPVQAIIPMDEVHDLLRIVGNVDQAFELIALLVVVVAGLGILVGLYNTIQGRRREIAILRALGAGAHHVFSVIVLEAFLLCMLGGVLGLVLGHGGVAAAGPMLLKRYAVEIDVAPGLSDVWILAGLAVLGLLVGLLPALRGLRTPVADNLYPQD